MGRLLLNAAAVAMCLLSTFALPQVEPQPYTNETSDIITTFPQNFDFGIATAPAHVEDMLEDAWIQWGEQNPTLIQDYDKTPFAADRLRFWSKPHQEIQLIKELNVETVRLGIDWYRLTPFQPGTLQCGYFGRVSRAYRQAHQSYFPKNWNSSSVPVRDDPQDEYENLGSSFPCRNGVQDNSALLRYTEILSLFTTANNLGTSTPRIMITLFHHSLPVWATDTNFGGWTNPLCVDYFLGFVGDAIPAIKHLVDRYVIFNEPAVYIALVYGSGAWPGRFQEGIDVFQYWLSPGIEGRVPRAFDNMVRAHKEAYVLIRQHDDVVAETKEESLPAVIGIAHNVAWHVPMKPSFMSKPIAKLMNYQLNTKFLELLNADGNNYLDFLGINYYSKEYLNVASTPLMAQTEYSETGRAVSPLGMYLMIKYINSQFNPHGVPILITENGIADATDTIRQPFLLENLLVVRKLMDEGVPITGYHFWTISDNMEWSDGYCPKFGLTSVDRNSPSLERTKRNSFEIYKRIIETREIIHSEREYVWNILLDAAAAGQQRPYCKSDPPTRAFQLSDWRFDVYLDRFSNAYKTKWASVPRVEGNIPTDPVYDGQEAPYKLYKLDTGRNL